MRSPIPSITAIGDFIAVSHCWIVRFGALAERRAYDCRSIWPGDIKPLKRYEKRTIGFTATQIFKKDNAKTQK